MPPQRRSTVIPYLVIAQICLAGVSSPSFAGASASTGTSANSGASDDGTLTVYNPPDSQLKPSLSACLKKRKLGTCLKAEMASSPENPGSPGINPNWVDFLSAVLGLRPADLQKGEFLDSVGANFSIDRLDPDEVLADPNKIATDRKLGGQGVWVRHFLEVVPPFGYERGNGDDLYAGGAFSLHGSLHIVRRHPMDQIYNNSMPGFTRSEIKILEQLAPTYLKIPYKFEGSGFLPGEGMEIEHFGTIELATGSAISLLADPARWFIQLGILGSVGPTATFASGHFRTLMELQNDGTLRVELEKLSENTENLEAQIDAGVEFSIVTFLNSLINMEVGISQVHKVIFDLNFDTKYAPAAHALKMAYLGRFSETLQLAAKATTNYQGVRMLDTSDVKEHSSEKEIQVFTFNKSTKLAHEVMTTKNTHDDADIVKSTIDSSTSVRNSSRSHRELDISFENTNGNSIYLKYKLKSNKAKPEEIREFSDLARLLGPASQSPEALSYVAPQAGKNKLDGFFYLAMDAQSLSSALDLVKDNDDPEVWITAWAKILGLPQPEHFAELSANDQETAASAVPDGKEHLQHFKNLVTALRRTLIAPNIHEESKTFIKSYQGEGTDLYPLAALASTIDRKHTFILEQVNLQPEGEKKQTAPDFMQFEEIGSDYVIPPKYFE